MKNAKRCSSAFALALDLDLLRLISFESAGVGGSMRHGWRIERCQSGMAVCAALPLDHSQNAAGTRGLIGRKEAFDYFSLVVSKE